MRRSDNPSAVESQRRIIESLIDLMQVKKIDDITISEISENAEVVRRTFYRNFKSREDVLDAYFDFIFRDIIETVDKMGEQIDCFMTLRQIIKSCYEHKDFFMALKKSSMLGFMLNKWNKALPVLHNLFLERIIKFPKTENQETLDYLLTFNTGGIFNIVIKWINDGMKLAPEELCDIIYTFAFATMYRDD